MIPPEVFNVATWLVDRNLESGRGANIAIECGDERVTYQQLAERVNRLGNALRALDVRIEERVLLVLLDTPEFAYSFLGAIKAGIVAVPVNTLLKPADYEYMLNDSRARVAIGSEALLPQVQAIPRERLRYLRDIVVVGNAAAGTHSFADLIARASPELEAESTSRDDAAFWLYSSGSTGFPKGCVHLHHDIVVASELYGQGILGITARDRCFSVAKLFFAYGLGNGLYFPFSVGATSILWPGPPTPPNVYTVIERHRPTLFYSVPTNYVALLAHRREGADFDLSTIRNGVSAGESLPAAVFERFKQRFGVEILDGLGSTELLHIVISNRRVAARPGSSGQVVPGFEARIVDENNEPVAPGETGSLVVRCDSTCAYYWNKHEKTKQTIEGHWIRTGDKYYQDADGYFWYAGRSDDMLKVSGQWVSPVEIEAALAAHPAVREAAVIGREDAERLVKPMAFVVLDPDAARDEKTARELQDFVAARLAPFKKPRWVEFVNELPKTATGKIQRFKLRERMRSAAAD
ncbi:MAG TPA: benzoate-CoA ligase family protein [Terriglobales bacterium]|nr:benzoate-CoA ligase family protein [Terriglobales bacterium]